MSHTRTQRWLPWLIWFFSGCFVLYQFMLQTSTSVMIPLLMRDFNINAVQVGFLSSSFLYTYLCMQVPSGVLVDRFGAKKILILGGIGSFIACLLFAATDKLIIAEFARLLMGLSLAPAFVVTLFLASNWFPVQRFALLVGLSEMMGMIGGIAGESNLAVWIGHFGWRVTLLGCGVIAVILTILAWLFVRDAPPQETSEASLNIPNLKELKTRFARVVKMSQVWLNGLFSAGNFSVVTAFAGLWAVPFIHTLYRSSLTTAALASSMIFLGVAIGSPVIGAVANIRAKRRLLMVSGTAACALLIFIILYVPGIPLSIMFVSLFFVGFLSCVYLIPFAIVRDITPHQSRGTAMGLTNMLCIILGAPVLQPLIGYFLELGDKSGAVKNTYIFTVTNYRIALTALPITLLLTLIIIPFIKMQNEAEQ